MRYLIPDDVKEKLKRPLGKIFAGEPSSTLPKIINHIRMKKPTKVIVVGDFSSRELSRAGLDADIHVIDGRIKREDVGISIVEGAAVTRITNPAGTISAEAFIALRMAINSNKRTVIIVDGEEDLLTLAAITLAPLNSVIIYGQPDEGAVVVEVTEEKKEEVERLLSSAITLQDY